MSSTLMAIYNANEAVGVVPLSIGMFIVLGIPVLRFIRQVLR